MLKDTLIEKKEKTKRIILHMGDSYPDESPCAKRMNTFYEAFIELGYQVKVLAPRLDEKQKSCGDIYYCPTFPLKKKSTINRLLNSMGFAVSSLIVSFCLGKADIVITTAPPPLISPFGWAIARLKRAKLVYDVRDIWPDVAWEMGSFDKRSVYSRVFEAVRNFMLRHSDLVTTVSLGKVKKLQSYEPRAKVIYVSNGLDEKFLQNKDNSKLVEKFNMKEHFNCVYIGNLGLAQGLRQLLSIAEKAQPTLPNVQFLLFGSGVEEGDLKQYVKEKELRNVIFAGRLPNYDMYTALKFADVSFVSLVNENLKDSVPTKLFEALGVGCPVLLAAVGDAVDVLEESKLGLAVNPNNEKGLWEAFQKIYFESDQILENKSSAQKLMCDKFSRQKIALSFGKKLRYL